MSDARVDALALRLLGRQVRRRAEHRRGLRRGLERLHARDAEVHDLHLALARDHHVRGLDVAVDDALRVRDRRGPARSAAPARPTASSVGRRPLARNVGERPALDELHDDVLRVAVGAGVVDADDVRVVEPCRGLRLAAEPRDEPRVARELREQDLDRDGAVRATGSTPRKTSAIPPGADARLEPVPVTERLKLPIIRLPQSHRAHASITALRDRRRLPATGRLVPQVAAVQHDNRYRDRGVSSVARRRERGEPRVRAARFSPFVAVPVLPGDDDAGDRAPRSPVPLATTSTIISRIVAPRSAPRSAGRADSGRELARRPTPCRRRATSVTSRGAYIVPPSRDAPRRSARGAAGSRGRCRARPPSSASAGTSLVEVGRARGTGRSRTAGERDRRRPRTLGLTAGTSGRSPHVERLRGQLAAAPRSSPTSPNVTLHDSRNASASGHGLAAAVAELVAEVLAGRRPSSAGRARAGSASLRQRRVAVLERRGRRHELERRPGQVELLERLRRQRLLRGRRSARSHAAFISASVPDGQRRGVVARVRPHREDVAVRGSSATTAPEPVAQRAARGDPLQPGHEGRDDRAALLRAARGSGRSRFCDRQLGRGAGRGTGSSPARGPLRP